MRNDGCTGRDSEGPDVSDKLPCFIHQRKAAVFLDGPGYYVYWLRGFYFSINPLG